MVPTWDRRRERYLAAFDPIRDDQCTLVPEPSLRELTEKYPGLLKAGMGAEAVLEVLERVNRELGTITAVITHNAAIAGMADRILHLAGGRITHVETNAHKRTPAELSW